MKNIIITEGELIGRARGLKEYIEVLEAAFDPNVKALQDKLIAAGAKIKADGLMGPATRKAQAQFPNITTQTDASKAVSGNINSANAEPIDIGFGPGKFQPDATAPAAAPVAAPAPAPAAPPAPAPVAAAPAGWTPTPEQVKWLGSADQQDPYILSRMPGVKPPVTHFKDPADQAKAKQMKFPDAPAPAATPAPAAAPEVDIGFGPGKFQPDATAPAATPAPAAPAVPGTAQTNPNALDKGEQIVPPPAAKESVSYRDDQSLARIVELSRR